MLDSPLFCLSKHDKAKLRRKRKDISVNCHGPDARGVIKILKGFEHLKGFGDEYHLTHYKVDEWVRDALCGERAP